MRRTIAAFWMPWILTAAGVASAGPGDFDPGYKTGARTFTYDYWGMTVLDGRLLISTTPTYPFTEDKPVVVALQGDGQVDQGFGQSGRLVLSVPPGHGNSVLAAVLPDGKFLVNTVADGRHKLLKLKQDGTLDPDFGVGGHLALEKKAAIGSTGIGTVGYSASIRVKPDGRMQVLELPWDCKSYPEAACVPLAQPAIVQQFMPDGTPDDSYGLGGRVDIPAPARASVAPFYMGGQDGAVALFGSDGELHIVAADGRSRSSAMTGFSAQTGAMLPDGRLLLVQVSFDGRRLEVVRLLPDATLDPAFGGGTGRSVFDPGLSLVGGISPLESRIYTVLPSKDGRYIYLGLSLQRFREDEPNSSAFAVVRLTASGELDVSFGRAGLSRWPSWYGWCPFVLDQSDHPLILARGQVIRLQTDNSPSPGLLEARPENSPGAVSEAAGIARVMVSRFAGRSGAISARVAVRALPGISSAGVATEGEDYSLRTTRLDWADGDESDKPILIDILDDKSVEPLERVGLEISADTGETRVFNPSATLVIMESDGPGSADNPAAQGQASSPGVEAGGGAFAPEGLVLLILWVAHRQRRRLRC